MKEACGVFGIFAPGRQASVLTFDALYALQHRGQESAGMAVSDGSMLTVVKNMGLVTNVFDERILLSLDGHVAIGHTRYSTTGESSWANAQPVFKPIGESGFALGHNGNITNTQDLADMAGMLPGVATSDSDVLAELIGYYKAVKFGSDPEGLRKAILEVIPFVEGAFSLVIMDGSNVIAVRDPKGLRPLCIGKLATPDGFVVASETPALDIVGASFMREVNPGELIVINKDGIRSYKCFQDDQIASKLCIFEFVYFARPDSNLYGVEVHGARRRMGKALSHVLPVKADMVMGVPESGVPAAEGYALESGIAYGQGLVKNRYIGRTFIDPSPEARFNSVRRKLNPLKENIKGKRLVVVDDSFVRGTTSKALVKMLKDAGAKEVHLRFSSPPFKWPCYYGIDIPTREELMAANTDEKELGKLIGADSVAFLSLEELEKAIGVNGSKFCKACLTGNYPTKINSGK